jgi:hypothetical protein
MGFVHFIVTPVYVKVSKKTFIGIAVIIVNCVVAPDCVVFT